MKPKYLRGLIVLNACLLAVLATVCWSPWVSAQVRPRGQYTMVSGTAQGAETSLVYILDETNQELVAVLWNTKNNQLVGIGYRNLVQDAARMAERN